MRTGAAIFFSVLLLSVACAYGGEADLESGITDPSLGPPYFGEAREIPAFGPLEGVRVRVQTKQMPLPVFVETDHDGRFRLQGFPKRVDPATVEFACDLEGYKLLNLTARRVSGAKNAPTEVECLFEKQ